MFEIKHDYCAPYWVIPMGKYFFKVSKKDSGTKNRDIGLVFSLLTLNK